MKVEFKTPFAEMTVEMGQSQAVALLRQALEYATYTKSPEDTTPPQEAPVEPVKPPAPSTVNPMELVKTTPLPRKEERGSRVETLFGNRTEWGTQKTAGTRPDPNEVGYKGFLYIYCVGCGQERGYCAKNPETKHKCKCGYHTRLQDLMPIYAKCKCGNEFKYRTNIETDVLTMDCLSCGAPIDLAMNSRRTAFVTVGSSDE